MDDVFCKIDDVWNSLALEWIKFYQFDFWLWRYEFRLNMLTELILDLRPAKGRRRYFVTTPLIGWTQT